jgi:hypothetical protein
MYIFVVSHPATLTLSGKPMVKELMENQNQNNMIKDGGNYFSAMFVHYVIGYTLAPIVLVLFLISILNPFWFREPFMFWVFDVANNFLKFQMHVKRTIYFWKRK